MPKFKVGDKVKILPRKDEWEETFPNYVGEMLEFENEIHPIHEICHDGTIKFDARHKACWSGLDGFYWHEDWLEPVKKRKFI